MKALLEMPRLARTFIRLSNKHILHVNITLYSEVYNILYSEVYWSCGPRAAAGLPATGCLTRPDSTYRTNHVYTEPHTPRPGRSWSRQVLVAYTPMLMPMPMPTPSLCDVLAAQPRLGSAVGRALLRASTSSGLHPCEDGFEEPVFRVKPGDREALLKAHGLRLARPQGR